MGIAFCFFKHISKLQKCMNIHSQMMFVFVVQSLYHAMHANKFTWVPFFKWVALFKLSHMDCKCVVVGIQTDKLKSHDTSVRSACKVRTVPFQQNSTVMFLKLQFWSSLTLDNTSLGTITQLNQLFCSPYLGLKAFWLSPKIRCALQGPSWLLQRPFKRVCPKLRRQLQERKGT